MLGARTLTAEGSPQLLFVENETNRTRVFGAMASGRYVKDGINDFVVHGRLDAVNPAEEGTKASARYHVVVNPGETFVIELRLSDVIPDRGVGSDFDRVFQARMDEADEYFASIIPVALGDDERAVMRQAIAGLLWSKQFYHYIVREWLEGDPASPAPPPERLKGRNIAWPQLYNADVISMPDKWDIPWYAAWDLAFHCVPLAIVDSEFAKEQLVLLLREWYMHPNGQLPAYEWALGDVNPPVHAWAAWRVYKIEKKRRGVGDRLFLERVFQKLMLNFTWWVNRKDTEGANVFEGGFLGLDNIGVFDRSAPLPTGGRLEQSDGTSWMGMYTLEHARDGNGARPREPRLRGRCEQVLGALPLHRAGDDQHRPGRSRPVGRARRVFLRRPPRAVRRAHALEGEIDGRPDSALRRRNARARTARWPAGLQEAPRMVRRPSSRPDRQRGLHAHARRVGTAAARDRRSRPPEAGAEDHARRERVPVALRHPGALAVSP